MDKHSKAGQTQQSWVLQGQNFSWNIYSYVTLQSVSVELCGALAGEIFAQSSGVCEPFSKTVSRSKKSWADVQEKLQLQEHPALP